MAHGWHNKLLKFVMAEKSAAYTGLANAHYLAGREILSKTSNLHTFNHECGEVAMKNILRNIAATVLFTVFIAPVNADGLYGTGDNFGGGWQADGHGNSRGTGSNFGRGWQSDGTGGTRGTGDNFGRGYQSDGNVGLRGTGDNFGGGWQSDGNGGYRGTGSNFGSGWQSDGNGGLRGTGDNFGRGYRK